MIDTFWPFFDILTKFCHFLRFFQKSGSLWSFNFGARPIVFLLRRSDAVIGLFPETLHVDVGGKKSVTSVPPVRQKKDFLILYILILFYLIFGLWFCGRMGAFWVWVNTHLRARPFCQDQITKLIITLCLSLLTSLFSYLLPKYFLSLVSSLTSWGLNAPRCMWLCHFFWVVRPGALSTHSMRYFLLRHWSPWSLWLVMMGGWPWHQNLK